MLNRTIAPSFGVIDYPELLPPKFSILSSGLKLYTIKAGDQSFIKLELILNTDIWSEKQSGLT